MGWWIKAAIWVFTIPAFLITTTVKRAAGLTTFEDLMVSLLLTLVIVVALGFSLIPVRTAAKSAASPAGREYRPADDITERGDG